MQRHWKYQTAVSCLWSQSFTHIQLRGGGSRGNDPPTFPLTQTHTTWPLNLHGHLYATSRPVSHGDYAVMSQGNEEAHSHSLRVSGNWKSDDFLFQACWQICSSHLMMRRRWNECKCSSPLRKSSLVCWSVYVRMFILNFCPLLATFPPGSRFLHRDFPSLLWKQSEEEREKEKEWLCHSYKLFIHTQTALYGLTPITDLYYHSLSHSHRNTHTTLLKVAICKLPTPSNPCFKLYSSDNAVLQKVL